MKKELKYVEIASKTGEVRAQIEFSGIRSKLDVLSFEQYQKAQELIESSDNYEKLGDLKRAVSNVREACKILETILKRYTS